MTNKQLNLYMQHIQNHNFNNLIIKFSLKLSQLLLLLRNISQLHNQYHMIQLQSLIYMENYIMYIRQLMNKQHNLLNKIHIWFHQQMELILQHMNMLLKLHFRMMRNILLQLLKFLKQYMNLLRLHILRKNQLKLIHILINKRQLFYYLNKFLLQYHKHHKYYLQNIN